MDILGLIGQQYMFLLLVVLFLGFGLGTWAIIKSLFGKEDIKGPVKTAINSNSNKSRNILSNSKDTKIIGGINMNSGWLKLGLFSLVGLVISFTILGFITSNNSYNMNMSNGVNMQGTMNNMGTNTHGASNMPMSANGMNNMSGQSMNSSYDTNMQNQLYQMQMQLNQMQMQLQNMNNNNNGQMQTQMPMNNTSNSSNSSSSSMSSGGSMGMMGMMGM